MQWCREMLALSPAGAADAQGALNAADDGLAGIQQLAGDATLLFYMTRGGPGGPRRLSCTTDGERRADVARVPGITGSSGLPVGTMILLPTGSPQPARREGGGHEPLQEQHPRHRVQPLRGARARRGPRPGPVRGGRRRHRQVDPGRGRPAGARGPRRVVRGRRPQPAGVRPDDQHRARAGVVHRRATRPGWTPSTGAWAPWPSSAARPPPRASTGRWASWCSARTPRSGCTARARCSPASCTATATSATRGSPS